MITYPVDLNAKYTVYNKTLNRVHTDGSGKPLIHRSWPRADGMPIVNLDPDLVILLEVYPDRPIYDSATQKIVKADVVYDIPNETATYGWNVVDLTQNELDAIAAQAAGEAELDIIRGIYLDLKNGVGTAGERLTRVERVLAYMLKRDYQP